MSHPIMLDSAGGEYMESVVVVEWKHQPGDKVDAGEVVVVVETAKAASEIEADHSGYLAEVFYRPGEEAPIGAVLGNISDEKPDVAEQPVQSRAATPHAQASASASQPATEQPAHAAAVAVRSPGSRIVASPLARRVARERGIDLARIAGSGPRGRIRLRDLDDAAAVQPSAPSIAAATDRMPVVFLHGFGADKSSWSRVVPLIDRSVEPVLVDLPGHGSSTHAPEANFEAVVTAVAEELEGRGITRAHFVGHSLGGAVALATWGLGRIAVNSMCLIAPAGLGPEINGGFIDGLINARSVPSLEPWLDVMTGHDFALPDGYAQVLLRQWQQADTQAKLRHMAAGIFPDGTQSMGLTDLLADLPVPAKIIWGLGDRIIPSAHAFHAPGTVALHLLKGAGHVPQLETPQVTARLINELLRNG
ncbi:alpha/beta fold hydrolase [Oricola thermophila]|uniref:Alpha/beta fold hydrolase n=1 Tax=Oricola thermophila TaxID=2742145 RepID=A0A6N1VM37_9HYPH|nr:alpha/beta fold hydrolase [Oricola thermophila]QKV20027.1 alpha/beta fold hydrolase [Oricola thermophila]